RPLRPLDDVAGMKASADAPRASEPTTNEPFVEASPTLRARSLTPVEDTDLYDSAYRPSSCETSPSRALVASAALSLAVNRPPVSFASACGSDPSLLDVPKP